MNQTDMLAQIGKIREYFKEGYTKPVKFRIDMLHKLKEAILGFEKKIYQALEEDLGKHEFEAFGGEIGFVLSEIDYAIRNLKKWNKPVRLKTPLFHFPGKSFIYSEPYGTVLIISPWNYPFQLTMIPLVGAICGGNTSVIKPSSSSRQTSKVMNEMIDQYFDPSYIKIYEIGRDEGNFLLEQKFDLIFYTGSSLVGKAVMAAASKNLTPVVLELSGKNPCIVDETADIRTSARRIVWGKFFNAGQSCIAPDYIFADHRIKTQLISEMTKATKEFFGENPKLSNSYCRIIDQKRIATLKDHLHEGKIVVGGDYDEQSRYFSPTIIENISLDSKIMQNEIFGPILPVVEYSNLNQVIHYISEKPKPLTLYTFTNNEEMFQKILNKTSSGSLIVNDTVSQHTSRYLPFGGVGESGMGKYHGESSFNAFSHKKSVMKKSFYFDFALRYPPYRKLTFFIKNLLKWTS